MAHGDDRTRVPRPLRRRAAHSVPMAEGSEFYEVIDLAVSRLPWLASACPIGMSGRGRGPGNVDRLRRNAMYPRRRTSARGWWLRGGGEWLTRPRGDQDHGANVGQNCPTPAPPQLSWTSPNML